MTWSDVEFSTVVPVEGKHHHEAAAGNAAVAAEARAALLTALATRSDEEGITHVLLKAAAGAGKTFVLKDLIGAAADSPATTRVGVVAFTNNQILPLAVDLGRTLGVARVCLHLSKQRASEASPDLAGQVTITGTSGDIPPTAEVIVTTASKLKAPSEARRMRDHLGPTSTDTLYDVLFVDEAWQLAHHLFDPISRHAPVVVGVGDVGQLPPLEIGANPWRGDARHNPYRAWPTAFTGQSSTWERELPAVWRPPAEALGLWRAFYPDWEELNSVAAPGDRRVTLEESVPSAPLWERVGTGSPTLVEVAGLPEADAPDVDLPLLGLLEEWLDDLFTAGFRVETASYDGDVNPTGDIRTDGPGQSDDGDPLVVVLATRNQTVEDATAMAERLRAKHGLRDRDLVASTVDSWQGQTNAITVAFHPLSGATELDEFNSAFGRLAVACTRATHGLLVLSRDGLDDLLQSAPARPGTPFGEPGLRQLPRQTHQRILRSFSRGKIDLSQQRNQGA